MLLKYGLFSPHGRLLDTQMATHVVSITSIDQSLDPSKVEWAIVNQTGQSIKEHYGFVDDADVYGSWFKCVIP